MDSARSDDTGDDALTTAQAAVRLAVAPNTVMNWVDAGLLRAWRTPGGHRRISAASVQTMLAQRLQQTGAIEDRPLRIAVVEDHPDTARVLVGLIRDILPGAEITVQDDGFQALLAAGREAPDLMLSDINLPGMNGIAMIKSLRSAAATRQIRFVLVSNYRREDLGPFGELPADVPLLAKPVQPDVLREALQGLSQAPFQRRLP